MIYCGSGSYFGKVLLPVPAPVPFPVQEPGLLSKQFFNTQKFVQNIAFSMLEAALFPRKFASDFRFFYFCAVLGIRIRSRIRIRMFFGPPGFGSGWFPFLPFLIMVLSVLK
jgi:hypothetical protein